MQALSLWPGAVIGWQKRSKFMSAIQCLNQFIFVFTRQKFGDPEYLVSISSLLSKWMPDTVDIKHNLQSIYTRNSLTNWHQYQKMTQKMFKTLYNPKDVEKNYHKIVN